jgi:uncharacterized membrane protein HdeD (DUF308 family)
VFLLTGILWIVVAFMVLAFDPTSAALIGYMTAFVLIAAGINELFDIAVVDSWKWLHGVLGALFIVTGILALLEPFQTFGILALLIGWYLLFKGTFGIVFSILERHELPLWGLALAVGIIEVLIGIWAIGYPGRSAALLILWIGIGALMRGIGEMFLAFRLRGVRAE